MSDLLALSTALAALTVIDNLGMKAAGLRDSIPTWSAKGESPDPRYNSYVPRLLKDISIRFGFAVKEDGDDDEEGGDEDGRGKQNRAEKKARKAIQKLGLKPVANVARVIVKKGKSATFVISSPTVFRAPGMDTYVIFGQPDSEGAAGGPPRGVPACGCPSAGAGSAPSLLPPVSEAALTSSQWVGASAMPHNSAYNPTGPVVALAYRTAAALRDRYLKSPGLL